MKYYSQKKYTIISNTSRVIAVLIMAAPLMWEGIDDVITSFYIEYGTLRTAITREIFKILIYFLLQIIIIHDGLSFSNVYSKINFFLTFPLISYCYNGLRCDAQVYLTYFVDMVFQIFVLFAGQYGEERIFTTLMYGEYLGKG